MMKIRAIKTTVRFFLNQCVVVLVLFGSTAKAAAINNSVIQFSETYELANIILALTEYGKTDKYEVNKNTLYYQEVLKYFAPVSNHAILEKVNYSREKWDKLLGFRTDAVAFSFDKNNRLVRKHKFYSMGKGINEFEQNLALIEDFVAKSNYREFYKSKINFFDSLKSLYEKSLMIEEVVSFLETEFKTKSTFAHGIIVSPLVGRMHCQRYFNGVSTSFIDIPDYLYGISDIQDISKKDIASCLHMFFTEIDHDFVNPTTLKYKKLYKKNFNPSKWDKGSGYNEYKYATFNEYMTWAVYDLFIKKHFPEVSDTVIKEWHDINVSRGFYASHIFGAKLLELCLKNHNETIKDLYPKLLSWCKGVEDNLEKKLYE